jgi:hypothetical protein
MPVHIHAVGRPELPPYSMPGRFRTDIAYFMSPPNEGGVPPLETGEYWVSLAEARRWLDEGVIHLISPLDSQHQTEVELSEEQEEWLQWMVDHEVEHIRISEVP